MLELGTSGPISSLSCDALVSQYLQTRACTTLVAEMVRRGTASGYRIT